MAGDGEKVALNVYDLSQGLARQLSSAFLGKVIEGIWHTGVVVYGREYYFGGGIHSTPEGEAATPYGKPIKVVELGYTHVPKEMLEEFLEEISPRYTSETYSLLGHNCNNFSEEVAQFLVGSSIPDYILNLPQQVMNSPMAALIMPMIKRFEDVLKHGGAPQVPTNGHETSLNSNQFQVPSSQSSSSTENTATSGGSSGDNIANGIPNLNTKATDCVKEEESNSTNDPLGEVRGRVQEEITLEFAKLMGEGSLRASEAAAIATRRVMARHGVATHT